MYKVSCSSCGQTVEITPDAALCSTCGNNLSALIPAEGTPQRYYARAEKYVDENDIDSALRVVQDGLGKIITSDLLLLGAILAEKLGQYDLMRHYVSRIPVDDGLRDEGEWLLRAHQTRQRAQRQGRDPSQAVLEELSETFGLPPEADYGELNEEDLRPPPETNETSRQRRVAPLALSLLLFIGLLSTGWFYREQLFAQPWIPAALRTSPEVEVMSPETLPENNFPADSAAQEAGTSANDSEVGDGEVGNGEIEVSPTEQSPVPATDLPDNTVDAAPTSTAEATPMATPTLSVQELIELLPQPPTTDDTITAPSQPEQNDAEPDQSILDGIVESSTPEPIAAADPINAVGALGQEPFDVLKYLRDIGRTDLAELPLDAQIQDGKLIVTGVVKWYEERTAIIDALASAPNVTDVNAIGLKTRIPDTYTVQEADTLWIIAFRVYGDGARWPQIYELNQNALSSPDTLGLGQVLQLPPQ